MSDEPEDDSPSLYAFELLEGEERTAFEARLARDPALREEVRRLREAAAAMAYIAPEVAPPPELKERILRLAERSAPAPSAPSGKPLFFPVLIPWAIAAGFAVAAVWMGELYRASSAANARLNSANNQLLVLQEQAQANVQRVQAELKSREDLAQLKISALVSLAGNSPKAQAVAVWDPARQEGILTVSQLPALAANKDYQLWVIDPQYPAPVSGGIFSVDAGTGKAQVVFKAVKPVKSAAKFAISIERKGGAENASGPIILLSQ